MAGAPAPRLPGRATSLRRSRESLELAAYLVGDMLRTERERAGLSQDELGAEAGIGEEHVSEIENGTVPRAVDDAEIDRLFARLGLDDAHGHALFLRWWRDNAEALGARYWGPPAPIIESTPPGPS